MGRYIRYVSEGSHRIMLLDCAGLKEAEILLAMEEYKQEILGMAHGTRPLVLMDMSKTTPYASVNAKGRELVEAAKAKGVPDYPTVIVGFSAIQKTITQVFISMQRNKNLHLADTQEEGKAWLLQRAQA